MKIGDKVTFNLVGRPTEAEIVHHDVKTRRVTLKLKSGKTVIRHDSGITVVP